MAIAGTRARLVTFEPTGSITARNVQDAVVEAAGGGGGGGGGGTPAGDAGQVQFNDDGAFGASFDLAYDTGDGSLVVAAHDAAEAGNTGGTVDVQGGASAGGDGGDAKLRAGNDSADGTGGNAYVFSGTSVDGDGGEVRLKANAAAPAGGDGGHVLIDAGAGTSAGGNVVVGGGGPDGAVQLWSGDGSHSVNLDSNGLHVDTTKLGFYSAAPVVRPTGVAVDAAAIHAALVTLGLIAT